MTAIIWLTIVMSVCALVRIVCIGASAHKPTWCGSYWRFATLVAPYVASLLALLCGLFDVSGGCIVMMLTIVLWVLCRRDPFTRR